MAMYIFKKAATLRSVPTLKLTQLLRNSSLYTPDYLDLMEPKIPHCPVVNVQIKGYVYPILENYQRLIDSIAKHLDIDVDNSYALAAKKLKIDRLKPYSSTVDAEYILDLYERNTQLSNLPNTILPIFIRLLEASLPEGVILNIDVWDPKKEEYRYVPDKSLMDLKETLQTMQKK